MSSTISQQVLEQARAELDALKADRDRLAAAYAALEPTKSPLLSALKVELDSKEAAIGGLELLVDMKQKEAATPVGATASFAEKMTRRLGYIPAADVPERKPRASKEEVQPEAIRAWLQTRAQAESKEQGRRVAIEELRFWPQLVADEINLHHNTVRRMIRKGEAMGKINRQGTGSGTYYIWVGG